MPKLPVIKAKELLRVLKRLGFYEHHQAGSHIQLKHPDGIRVTLPYHPSHEIRRGTLRGVINDLEMNVEEFVRVLKKK